MTECDKWLNTVTDSELDNHSQSSLANEAWRRGAAHAAQEILNHLELIDTVKIGVTGRTLEAMAIGAARVTADRFIAENCKELKRSGYGHSKVTQ